MQIDENDIDEVLRRAFPQGTALLRLEGGIELLRHGAREIVSTPWIGREVLSVRGAKAMAGALRTLSGRYAAIADALDGPAAEAEAAAASTPGRACLQTQPTEGQT